jgi:hypothetical protein
VTVLDISDAMGNTIESGIDAFINFTTPSDFTPELESAGPEALEPEVPLVEEVTIEPEVTVEPTAELPVESVTPAPLGNNAGTTISTTGNTLNAAQENDNLPKTGPEHWVLAFIALLLT